jgi:N-acetylated-alpha-linked acidic dipeptidase
VRKGDEHPDFIDAFNAYSPAATVTGDLVYTHYARVEDLRKLQELGVNMTGKIALSRYGKIFRGNKVKNCQEKGFIGVILFSDPGDVALDGTDPDNVYPNTIYLPGSGIQRGNTKTIKGDPLSPYWSSVPNSYRADPKTVEGLPKIPSQPIGYDDAKELLKQMGGNPVPEEWRGNITGVDYRLGGVMLNGTTAKLSVHNYFGNVRSSNVIGYIKGSIDPDRYVILGNHRDAWGYGAMDPSSGTASLMETVRSFGQLLKKGWRPRRTVVFASWAAEEYGLEGSYEWVFQHLTKLMHRGVSVLNVDTCVTGPIALLQATPLLKDVALRSLKMADDPTSNNGRKYYYFLMEWIKKVLKIYITFDSAF